MRSSLFYILISGIFGLALGTFVTFLSRKLLGRARLADARKSAAALIDDAKRKSADVVRDAKMQAKDQRYRMQQEFERETRQGRKELQKLEKRLRDKQEKLDRKIDFLERRQNELEDKESQIHKLQNRLESGKTEYNQLIQEVRKELEKVSHLTAEEAKNRLIKNVEEDARMEAAKRMRQIEEDAKDTSERKANWIIGNAVQRLANHHVQEKTVSVVQLPSDDLKGRIIGREGRNIRTLEQLVGIDLIVDDTPEAVVISSFNPLRREIARLSLEELISDGRIHPARIEEVVHKVEKQLDKYMRELGEQAVFDLGIQNMHPELLKLVGKLNYRTSYGQNQYKHAIEVAFIAGMIAAEFGEDIKIAKRGGLLHDIGKVMDHDVEGGHAVIGAEFARKHGEEKRVWHAIGAHHEDYPIETLMDIIVQVADALSGARPGARREVIETYIKRLDDLEGISQSFKGVEKAYAIQAGREVRVVVANESLSDEETVLLSRDIAKKIEQELTYPGQIKVTVIRETRAVEFAK